MCWLKYGQNFHSISNNVPSQSAAGLRKVKTHSSARQPGKKKKNRKITDVDKRLDCSGHTLRAIRKIKILTQNKQIYINNFKNNADSSFSVVPAVFTTNRKRKI